MKSLKPVNEKTSLTSKDALTELRSEIDALNVTIQNQSEEIESLRQSISSPTVTKELVTADRINSTNSSFSTVDAAVGTIDVVNSTEINADEVNTRQLNVNGVFSTEEGNITNLDSQEVHAASVQTQDIDSNSGAIGSLESDSISATDINARNGTFNSITANRYTIENVSSSTVTTSRGTITNLSSDAVNANDITTTDIGAINGELEHLENRDRFYYNEDVFITVDSGSDSTAPDESFIAIPLKNTQTFKCVLKNDQDLFQVIYTNSKSTPLVQWSKQYEKAIAHFYFSPKTETLYIGTYSSGRLYYGYDGEKSGNIPSVFYEHLPENKTDLYRYNVNRLHGLVLMGEGGADTVLSVQGTIEGKFVQDDGDFVYLNVYTDSAEDLFKLAKSYLRSGNEQEGYSYEEAEVFGYLDTKEETREFTEEVETNTYTSVGTHTLLDWFENELKLSRPQIKGQTVYVQRTFTQETYSDEIGVRPNYFFEDGTPIGVVSIDTCVIFQKYGVFHGTLRQALEKLEGVPSPSTMSEHLDYLVTPSTLRTGQFNPYLLICTKNFDGEDVYLELSQQAGVTLADLDEERDFYSMYFDGAGPRMVNGEEVENLWDTEIEFFVKNTTTETVTKTEVVKGGTESLEKVKFQDEHTIVLTVDAKYGQDEITITDDEDELPFTIGFTIRTPKIDKAFNSESKPIPNNAIVNDQVGY